MPRFPFASSYWPYTQTCTTWIGLFMILALLRAGTNWMRIPVGAVAPPAPPEIDPLPAQTSHISSVILERSAYFVSRIFHWIRNTKYALRITKSTTHIQHSTLYVLHSTFPPEFPCPIPSSIKPNLPITPNLVARLSSCSIPLAPTNGAPVEELTEALRAFDRELKADPLASLRVEVAVVTFGGEVRDGCHRGGGNGGF